MTHPLETPFEERLQRLQRQRDLALRGYERNRMSPELAEALRSEIRQALDADGKPFDVVVARRVYDLAIAAKDMCVAATAGVGEAIKTIADNGGPIESLGELEPGAPAVQAQASETFGARILRELMASLKPPPLPLAHGEDAVELVNAIAEARRAGMTDVAEALEVKLLGRALDSDKPIAPVIDVPEGSYQHGFADGKAGLPPTSDTVTYKNGWTQGTTERFLNQKPDMINVKHAFEPRVTDRFAGPCLETCEHCGTDPRNVIHEDHEKAFEERARTHASDANGVTIV